MNGAPTVWQACAGCRTRFERPANAECGTCLTCETRNWLRIAGIPPDDPGLIQIRRWNAKAIAKASE